MRMRWICGLLFSLLPLCSACGETYSTPNFVAHCSEPGVAERVARAAEYFRKNLAIEWTGRELPKWSRKCPILVNVGSMGASGSTTFTFEGGEVHSWDMKVNGSCERILDSVVPHEVCHTIFASKFRRPLPRWADEGAATLVEHHTERLRQVDHLNRVFGQRQQIPLRRLFEIREYPSNQEELYTLYAEGYSLAEFLVQRSGEAGKRTYLTFLGDALGQGWDHAIQKHYGYQSIGELERDWGQWVLAGSPNQPRDIKLAGASTRSVESGNSKAAALSKAARLKSNQPGPSPGSDDPTIVIRSQTPSEIAPLAMITRSLRRSRTTPLEAPPPVGGFELPEEGIEPPVRLRLPGTRGERSASSASAIQD